VMGREDETSRMLARLLLAGLLALLVLAQSPWSATAAGGRAFGDGFQTAQVQSPQVVAPQVVAPPAAPPAAKAAEPQAPASPPNPPAEHPAVAEPVLPPMDDLLNPVKEATGTIEALEKIVERVKDSDAGLSQQRSDIEALLAELDKAADALKPRMDAAKAQSDKLGPAPKPGAASDAPEIASERARLTAILTTLEGATKSVELVRVRARQLAIHVQELRQALFTKNLFQRSGSPILPGLWQQISGDSMRAAQQFESVFGTWRAIIANRLPAALTVLGLSVLAYIVLWLLTRRGIARLAPRAPAHPPTFTARAVAATLTAPLYIMPAAVAATVLYLGASNFDLVYSRVEAFLQDSYQALLTFSVVSGLASAILTPRKPLWRLIDVSDATAGSLWRSVRMVALVYALDLVLKELIRLLALPLPFHVALSFITALAFAFVLMRIVTTPFVPTSRIIADAPEPPAVSPPSRWTPRWLKLPLLVVAIGIVAVALAGYVALSRFVAGQVVITGSAVVLVLLLHLAIRTIERATASEESLLGSWLHHGLGLGETHRSLVGHGISALLHAVLAVLAIPVLLLAWGFSINDVAAGLRSALFGFEIGHFRISLARLLMAIGLFAALLFTTRLLQRWLQGTFLRPDRMDAGIANSIYQGIGYVGFGIAALVSISFGGIDITNLAILAGALSVGIGFGLQSIVNNFVSGLILLVERPIKVGDWIVLKDGGQGYVRSISVRSTEIETFDRSSLIVPNSELISSVVTNWTHRNSLGRVVIKVAASYKSDPRRVLEILTACAKTSPLVLQQPAPLITLDNFGGDGLEFSVRVVVADINRALAVQTELRAAIFTAFRENGIEFPTVERDIYLRDLDGLKTIVARVLEERARNATQPPPAAAKAPFEN